MNFPTRRGSSPSSFWGALNGRLINPRIARSQEERKRNPGKAGLPGRLGKLGARHGKEGLRKSGRGEMQRTRHGATLLGIVLNASGHSGWLAKATTFMTQFDTKPKPSGSNLHPLLPTFKQESPSKPKPILPLKQVKSRYSQPN